MKIEIPDDCKKIHLLFSGGIDSTLLLFLLLKEIQLTGNNIPIKCYTFKSNENLYCKNIINWMNVRFNHPIDHQYVSKNVFIRDIVRDILAVESGYVYSGCNKVLNFLTPANYIPNDTPPFRGESFNEFHVRPFIDIDKKEIISYYIQYNIVDLLAMTYSCGYDLKIPCGNCYFCLERNWGLVSCGLKADS